MITCSIDYKTVINLFEHNLFYRQIAMEPCHPCVCCSTNWVETACLLSHKPRQQQQTPTQPFTHIIQNQPYVSHAACLSAGPTPTAPDGGSGKFVMDPDADVQCQHMCTHASVKQPLSNDHTLFLSSLSFSFFISRHLFRFLFCWFSCWNSCFCCCWLPSHS